MTMENGREQTAAAMKWLKDNGSAFGVVIAVVGLIVGALYHFNGLLADKIDAVDANLAARIDAVDEKLTGRIDAVDVNLAARIDAVDARVGRVEDRLSSDILALEERLGGRIDAADDGQAGPIDKWARLPIWRILPIQAATEPQAYDWSRTVPAALNGNVLTLYPGGRDSEMTALLRKGGWHPVDPDNFAAGLVLRGTVQ